MKNIFVIGREETNFAKLRSLQKAPHYTFHGLLDYADIRSNDDMPVPELLDRAEQQLCAFPGSIDAIVGYWDFPVSDMVPILCKKFGLRSASLSSILKCEHKYWSRVEQQKAIPEHVPRFISVDPFDDNALAELDVRYPFWIKPIKSFRSHLAFRVRNARDLRTSIAMLRAGISRLGNAFNDVLNQIDLPPDFAHIDGNYCIVEEALSGQQCTLEGYAFEGEIVAYGVVDSIHDVNRTSFARYQYPSRLPRRVQQRMREAAIRVMSAIGFDNGAFNIEFFYDQRRDRIGLLEINPRTSQSHTDLFEHVDGVSNLEVMVDVALGQRPALQPGQQHTGCAAKFFVRRYHDALVTSVPDADTIAQIESLFPGTRVEVNIYEDMRLSELPNQDSYSYEIATLHLHARNQGDLIQQYRVCLARLPFGFAL